MYPTFDHCDSVAILINGENTMRIMAVLDYSTIVYDYQCHHD